MTKVLVIEDDPAIRANIVDLMEVEGFTALAAGSGRVGLDLFRRERPDLVICDLKLPELDGFGVLEALRQEPEGGDTPFIFLSAHAERGQIRRGMTLGADDYISKPFTTRELLDAVQGRLTRHARIRAQTPAPAAGPPARPSTPPPGVQELYGNYRVLSQLGSGGMGAVYLAEHVLIGRQVAIKVLLPQLSQSRENVGRFFNEARSAASIHDPGIVDVFDFGYDAHGNGYLVMELLAGESLRAYLPPKAPRPSQDFALSAGRQIARAMASAHARHIVHRDLKPDNVFLVRDPDLPLGLRVKVLDFGMAKLGVDLVTAGASTARPTGPSSILTKSGSLLGTPLYMSPEQCRGLGEVDHRADIYALGCVLYEMLCGQPPFVRGGVGLILASHIFEPPPSPRSFAPDLDIRLETLLLRMLAKSPEARPATMDELALELIHLQAGSAARS